MPPKRRAAGSATSTNTTAGDAPTTSTSTTPPMSPTTRQRRSSTTVTTADKDLTTNAQDNRPTKKPRTSSTKKATPLPVPDVSLGQDTTNATATINHNTIEGTTDGESVLPSTGTNTDAILVIRPASASTEPTATLPTVPISPDEKPRRPFKARGPRGPYKPRKPKPTNSLPPPPPESGLKLLKTSNELAFKDSRPWHDYFQDRIPTFNSSTSLWEFPSPPPRVDVLAPKELNKMISDDYARMKPLPDGPSLRTSSTTKSAAAKTSTVETGTQEQQQTASPSNNDSGKKGNGQEDTQAEQPQEHDSDEETQSDDASDSDDDEDSDDNRRSQSVTPGPSGNADGTAPNKAVNNKRHKKAKKHRVRIKYSFPAPVPPLEYPYLQSAFPYENHPSPKSQATTQPDYGQHSQPLPDVWHRPQKGFAVEDLFSQEKLDYSIRMLRKQPIEAHRLRMDLYFRRGFQLASKQVLDRARVAYYGKNDYTNKHYLQVPSLYNEMDEARLRSSERSRKDVNILRGLDADGKIALRGHSLLRAIPSASAAKPPILATTSTESTTEAQTTATTAPPMSSGSRVIGGAFSSSVTLSSSAPPPVSQSTSSAQVDEASEALARDKLAYYEVNQFLGSMFSHRNLGSKAQALSPRACTILRTLMSGLEKKVVSMGCELQRAELTKRLAEIDTFLSKRHREMIRVRVGKARRERQRGREEPQQAVATIVASSPDSSLASSSTPVSMSPAATAKGTGAGDSADPTSPATFAALERRFYPIWDCDPGEYYIRTATSNNPMTHVSALASAIDDPLGHPPADRDGSPFLPPAADGGTMTTATTATTEESGWPFISNPLRIPEEMEPFWKVRNYLERLPPPSSVSSTPAAAEFSTTTVTEGGSNIEQIHQARQDLSTPEPSTSTSSSMSPLLAPTMTTSAVGSRNSEIELLRHAQQAIASATRVALPLVSSSSIAMSSTSSTTAARVTTMTSEIELLRVAQQDLARAGAAARMVPTSHPSSTVASSSSSTSTTTPSVMSMTSEIERLRLAQQELARAGGN
ncbi:hypothetical protein EC957_005992 [Mortierella hygrophila]|uniref:Uncharacterized protein n=1 Tax=Mortierella hygrophila TaxID=979708 RepID=A0A9P6F017_9FUNG|nr:hypothetical protein EC957_005992 [Mortierella hygrophila]